MKSFVGKKKKKKNLLMNKILCLGQIDSVARIKFQYKYKRCVYFVNNNSNNNDNVGMVIVDCVNER